MGAFPNSRVRRMNCSGIPTPLATIPIRFTSDAWTMRFFMLCPFFSVVAITHLSSPENSIITYYYYLYVIQQNTTDKLEVLINNNGGEGVYTTIREYNRNTASSLNNWVADTIRCAELIALGIQPTQNMKIQFIASSDIIATYALEAGLDNFEVSEVICNVK